MLYVYLTILVAITTVWAIVFHFKHTRVYTEDLGHPGVLSLGTLNGIGESLLGGFKNAQGGEVYYVMFTIFFLPICPVKCIVASYKGYDSFIIGGTSKYEVFHKTSSNWKEVLSIYAFRWGLAILFVITIILLSI